MRGEPLGFEHKSNMLKNGWRGIYSPPRVAGTDYPKLGGLKQQTFILSSSRGQESKIKMSAGLDPSGDSLTSLAPGFWWFPTIYGAPWLIEASLQPHMAIYTWPSSLCFFFPPFFSMDVCHWLWIPPGSHRMLSFQDALKPNSQVLGRCIF